MSTLNFALLDKMLYVREILCFHRGVIKGSGVWNVSLHSWVGGPDVSEEYPALILKVLILPRHRDTARRNAPSQNAFVAISYVTVRRVLYPDS